jgi:hypothetical protein
MNFWYEDNLNHIWQGIFFQMMIAEDKIDPVLGCQ